MKKIRLLPFILLASCASPKKNAEQDDKKEIITAPVKKIIGRIASVSRAGEFVLIQKFGPGILPENTIYQSQGPEGRSASLRPSGERIRDFYAADLVSGHAEKGDAVLGYPDPKKKAETGKTPPLPSQEEPKTTPPEKKNSAQEKLLKTP